MLAVMAFHVFPAWGPGGYIGVDLFFVISGFVITAGLLREEERDRVSLRAFYVRRIFRILPPLFAMLLVTSLVVGWQGAVLPAAASYMNWHVALGSGSGSYFLHSWTLSAEEQFYFLWPIAFLALAPPRRAGVLAVLIAAMTLWRVALNMQEPWERIYYGLDTHGDGLLLGCLIAVWRPRVPSWSWLVAAPPLLLFVLLSAPYSSPAWIAAFTWVPLASAVLVLNCLDPSPSLSRLLAASPAQWIGLRSYSLYLWHFPVYAVCSQLVPGPAQAATALLLTFLVADLSYRRIEMPCMSHGRRLTHRTGPPQPEPAHR